MRNIKLIWDFRGPDAQKIAEHHHVHLNDYLKMNTIDFKHTGVEVLSSVYCIAFIIVKEDIMKSMRDALKPHRGQVYTE